MQHPVKRYNERILTLPLFLLCALLSLIAPAHAGSKMQWVLNVDHKEGGHFLVSIADDRIRIDCPSYRGTLVAKAPDWRVYCYRIDERTCWSTNKNELQGIDSLGAGPRRVLAPAELVPVGSGMFNKLPCSIFKEKFARADRTIWLTDRIQAAPQCAEIICRFFSLPLVNKVPVQIVTPQGVRPNYTSYGTTKSSTWKLVTESTSLRAPKVFQVKTYKRVPYQPSDFDCPKSLTKVRTAMEVFFSKAQKDEISDMLNDIGFATTTAKPARQR